MSKQVNTPEIRFLGFDEEWEDRELGEVGSVTSGIGFPEIEQGGSIGIPFFKVSDMNLSGNERILNRANNYVNSKQMNKHGWSPVSSVPAIMFAKVGAAVFLNRKRLVTEPFLMDNNNMAYMFCDDWDVSFGQAAFERLDLSSLVQVGALPSLNASDIESQRVVMPHSPAEQEKIGELFENLGSLIDLHQKELRKLRQLKKAMLSKMFPKSGAAVPEVRFTGFDEEWDSKKLAEIVDVSSAARVHKHEWRNSGVPFFRTSDVVAAYKGQVNQKAFISVNLFEQLSNVSGRVQKNDLLVTGGGSIGTPYKVQDNSPLYFKDADLLWLKTADKISSAFLYAFYESPTLRKYLRRISHIGTIAHYTIEQCKETPIHLPSLPEQQKIGEFFENLDSLIDLQVKQGEKLSQIKHSLLSKMFV